MSAGTEAAPAGPATGRAAGPTVEPATGPAVEPATDPAVEAIGGPAVESGAESAVEPTAGPTVEAIGGAAVEPADGRAVEAATPSVGGAAVEAAGRSVGDLTAVVLAGGLAYERDVSIRSGRRVCEALKSAGASVRVLDADAALVGTLTADRPDAVFIALHGGSGEDGALRTVLDLAAVPYAGSDAAACRVAWDKPNAKAAVRAAGLSTPDWVALPHSTFRELGAAAVLDRIVDRLGMPLMVKPAQGGSALGAQVVRSVAGLPDAMISCLSYGDTVLVEPYVTGVEVAVSVVDLGDGPVALPAVEIEPSSGVFDYASRYTAGTTTYHTPARLPADVAARVAETAVRAHTVLGLRDLSRTDAIVTPAGTVEFLEVNVSPGMTETSLLPMAVEAAGLDLGAVCATLLRRAAAR